jgi:hypothetical protein
MRTRDNLNAVVDALRERHSLLAAYLEAADRIDRRAVNKPVATAKLALPADGGLSDRRRSELTSNSASAASVP